VAAEREVVALKAKEAVGLPVREAALDRVLDAQRRLVEAEIAYYDYLINYNLAITQIHFRKGSLLEYNGVYLAEGPWPGKAYFDARRRARSRDASLYLDYGFTRPKVISRGRYEQHAGGEGILFQPELATEAGLPGVPVEEIPTPAPEPAEPRPAPDLSSEPGASNAWPKADGPQLSAAPTARGHGTGGPNGEQNAFDLGSLNLDVLGTGSADAQPTAPQSPVEPVSYQQVESPSQSVKAASSSAGWRGTGRSSSSHESVANPPSAEADWPSPGWKGVQR